jgi:Transposase DDE domain group 1
MEMVAGEAEPADLRVAFDRRLKLEFHGTKVTSEAGLLAFRELDDALGLTEMAGQVLADSRTGKNNRHTLTAQFRQSCSGGWPGTRMSTTPTASAMIRRCAGSSAAGR